MNNNNLKEYIMQIAKLSNKLDELEISKAKLEFDKNNLVHQINDLKTQNETEMKLFSFYKSNTIGINNDNNIYLAFSTTKTKAEIQALCPIYIQYKLSTATTEKVEKNHYATYNQTFILEHNKSEAERSANFWDKGDITFGGEYTNLYKNLKAGTYSLRISKEER